MAERQCSATEGLPGFEVCGREGGHKSTRTHARTHTHTLAGAPGVYAGEEILELLGPLRMPPLAVPPQRPDPVQLPQRENERVS